MLMREAAIKHGMESAKNVLRPFSRVMLKLISTGNQLSPDMINADRFPGLGPEYLQGRGAAEGAAQGDPDADAEHHRHRLGGQPDYLGRAVYDLGG